MDPFIHRGATKLLCPSGQRGQTPTLTLCYHQTFRLSSHSLTSGRAGQYYWSADQEANGQEFQKQTEWREISSPIKRHHQRSVCVCVRQCEWHGSKRVSCIQKFPCLMCLGDDMEVSTHPYSLCTNSDSEINNIFKFLPVFIKGWKFPTAPSLFPISAAPCNCILTFTLATDRWALYPKIYTSNSLVAHQTTALKLCIVYLFNPGLKTAFILTFPSSRNVWEYFKLLLSGPETAVGREAGTEKFAQRVRLPVGPSPFYPSQWRDWPVLHKDIPGQAISPYKAKECTGYSLLLPQTLLGMFGGKGRNDRNYDKAALFREKGLNI